MEPGHAGLGNVVSVWALLLVAGDAPRQFMENANNVRLVSSFRIVVHNRQG
jgi:hypothetical protein